MTTWFEVIALWRDLMLTWDERAASRARFVVIASSGGFASGHAMTGWYDVIVIGFEGMVVRSEGMSLRSPLWSTARRDAGTWSSVVFSRSLVVAVRYELVGAARDAMPIYEDRVTASGSGMVPLRRDRGVRDSLVEERPSGWLGARP
jgi:hypothetical protein